MADGVGSGEHVLGLRQHGPTGRRKRHELLAAALEQIDAELLFEQANLLADAGLGREQARGGGRDVEVPARYLYQVTQLLKLHSGEYRRRQATL